MPVKILNINHLLNPVIRRAVIVLLMFFLCVFACANLLQAIPPQKGIKTGADRTDQYFGMLKGKKVAVVANQTSQLNNTHLVDTLIQAGINIICVFAPEHGFRGEAEAGEYVTGGVDATTGVKVISLYGDHKKPDKNDLNEVDIVLFDIQDVGVRFYTYISTLQYIMEACAEFDLPLIVLDRPNPNGHYVDGPVLESPLKSFVGMQKIPVVYGMTIGEYAMMLNGEKWLENGKVCSLNVVKLLNWDHEMEVELSIPPSPNLPNLAAVRLYPSLCFFEGTSVSLGRGTGLPFQCFGYPGNLAGDYIFIPRSMKGKANKPLYENMECRGKDLSVWAMKNRPRKLDLTWLIDTWKNYTDKEKYFTPFFDKLAGTAKLRKQIEEGWSEERIRASWEKDISEFKLTRMKYLLYP